MIDVPKLLVFVGFIDIYKWLKERIKRRKQMIQNKERTALNPSVAAEGEQPLTNHNASIADDAGDVNPQPVNSGKREKNRLKTVSMTDLYNQVYTGRPPIINGLLYPGTYILVGAPKLGKSFLMAQLAYHVSTGTDMWGFPVQKGSVLYLALEDDYGRLQKRLYKMFGVETAKNLYFGIEAPSLGDGLIDLLEGFVEDHPDTRLIIVDTLQKIRGNNDGHTYSSDYQDICQFKRFTDLRNLCLMIVHHTRKQQSEDRFDTISGTNGLLGAADGAFLLTKAKRTANDAMLDIAGRDQQDQRLHLVRNTKTLLWEMESAETELWEEEPDPLLEEVAKVVSEENPKWKGSVTALAKQIQYSSSPISLAMKLNVSADRLKQDYHIKYERYRSHKGRGVRLTLEFPAINNRRSA